MKVQDGTWLLFYDDGQMSLLVVRDCCLCNCTPLSFYGNNMEYYASSRHVSSTKYSDSQLFYSKILQMHLTEGNLYEIPDSNGLKLFMIYFHFIY